jgi:carboxyl-terminal processing protease
MHYFVLMVVDNQLLYNRIYPNRVSKIRPSLQQPPMSWQLNRGELMQSRVRHLPLTALAIALAASLLSVMPTFERRAFAETHVQIERSAETRQDNVKVFNEVWRRVHDSFYDPKFRGLNWKAIGEQYRAQATRPAADLTRVINGMLAELGASHTAYYTPADTAYYDLADIFSGGLRKDLPKYFPRGEVSYTGIGMLTRVIEGRHFISGVLDGFPAAAAKLTVGDELIAVDGAPFEPVKSFAEKAGRKVTLTIRRQAEGETQNLTATPQRLRPNEMYRDAMEKSARIIEAGGRKIGYVHMWSYARSTYQQLLEDVLTKGKLKGADALIWDLRDGWGGADPGYLDIFNPRSPTMTLTKRSGEQDIVNGRWRKPVVLLINGGTRSGKEVLAHGFQKYGLGPIVGTRSAGALLAGRAYLLSNGGLLLLAVADVSVDGERLEGRGVTPLVTVPFDIRYAQGKDPQLARALELLAQTIGD